MTTSFEHVPDLLTLLAAVIALALMAVAYLAGWRVRARWWSVTSAALASVVPAALVDCGGSGAAAAALPGTSGIRWELAAAYGSVLLVGVLASIVAARAAARGPK